MKIRYFRLLERFIIFLNKTILKRYQEWKWDEMSKPVGQILYYKDLEEDEWM